MSKYKYSETEQQINDVLKYHDEDYAFKLGYEVLGPLLLGFTEWIHNELRENNSGLEERFFKAFRFPSQLIM